MYPNTQLMNDTNNINNINNLIVPFVRMVL